MAQPEAALPHAAVRVPPPSAPAASRPGSPASSIPPASGPASISQASISQASISQASSSQASSGPASSSPASSGPGASELEQRDDARLRKAFDEHYGFVWRYLRRLGLAAADADDATQQVFVVLSRKLDRVELGKERAYLCGVAVRVCSELRRAKQRRREVTGHEVQEPTDASPGPDGMADKERARALLDEALDQMDDKLRAVFVLFELEEQPTAAIGDMLELPTGTVASRLRRGREQFHAIIKRMRARGRLPGGER
jgi:RNA polymerase sigma-70 factor, ECF subfamily